MSEESKRHVDTAKKTSNTAIEYAGVSFSYNAAKILDNVNLTIGLEEFACIVGPNGGGKTTLIKLALGLLRPATGQVRLLGDTPKVTRKRVGYMPQNAQVDSRFPIAVRDVVFMGRLDERSFGSYSQEDRAIVERALSEVGLERLQDRSYATLSGGEQRRVLIARALACDPELLILDEPTANLDPEAERELYHLLSKLNQWMAVVVVSHDMHFVSQFVQRVICVMRGVQVHQTSEITDRSIAEVFRKQMRIVHHEEHSAGDSDG